MERNRASVIAARQEFMNKLLGIAPERLVFLDETGSHIAMTRSYGRAVKGVRVVGRVPRNRGEVTTVIGALALRGLTALMAVQGGTSKDVFLTFVNDHLAPTLLPGDVVVMDNLGAHHAHGVRDAIEAVGASVLYMPPYSPDFNPIELCWSKFKDLLRTFGARTVRELYGAVVMATEFISPQDALGWFTHCGYVQPQAS